MDPVVEVAHGLIKAPVALVPAQVARTGSPLLQVMQTSAVEVVGVEPTPDTRLAVAVVPVLSSSLTQPNK